MKMVFVLVLAMVCGLGTCCVSAAPIHDAVAAGELDKVKELVEKDPSVLKAVDDSTDLNYMQYLPLHLAVKKDLKEIVAYLLEKGADPNGPNGADSGVTPMHVLGQTWNQEIAELLIAKGGKANIVDQVGSTILSHTVGWGPGNEEFVRYLVGKGADPKLVPSGPLGTSALHDACLYGFNLSTVKFLVEEAKVDANILSKSGQTPLVYACQAVDDADQLVTYLVSKGADPTVKDDTGNSLLLIAAPKGNLKLLEFLLSKKADPKAVNKSGENALHRAIYGDEEKQVPFVEKLLALGVDSGAKNAEGKTPLDLAKDAGKTKLAALLTKGK